MEPNLNRVFYLPRLAREHYQGDAVVHWTLSLLNRAEGWLGDVFHADFRELMMHAAAREGFYCPVYCLMPDHLHFVCLDGIATELGSIKWHGIFTDAPRTENCTVYVSASAS